MLCSAIGTSSLIFDEESGIIETQEFTAGEGSVRIETEEFTGKVNFRVFEIF